MSIAQKTKARVAIAALLGLTLMGGAAIADHHGGGCKSGKFFGSGKELNLSVEQVKTLAEARLIRRGNPNMKLGAVTKLDDGMVEVRIVTQDDSLVKVIVVDPKTGKPKGRFQAKQKG